MKNRPFLFFSLVWLALFIFQGWWTPPHIDEVYYWRFSQELDWGFFDHPPMVALMIYLSDLVFKGHLAIRAVTILMTLVTIYIVWKIIDLPEKTHTFWYLIFSLPLLHLYGFITTPDVPLLFFGALFFFYYKRLLEDNSWLNFVLWGGAMGLMLYSKYHGALLIIFTLVSKPKLLLNPKTYVAGILGLIIWAPHIIWQYDHNWMTFRYHLSERVGEFKWFYPLEYLGNLLVVFNPLLIGLLISTFRQKWQDDFERSLYYVLVGFTGFFALQSFRDHVQPQWLILTYLPFIILVIRNAGNKQQRLIKNLFLISIPLFIALHLFMTFDLLKTNGGIWRKDEFVQKIEAKAGERPVVFFDSYQDPSIYKWYRPKSLSHSFNRSYKRKNQFNIWMQDTMMNGQEVYVFAPQSLNMPEYLTYKSFDKLKVRMSSDSTLQIENSYDYSFSFAEDQINIDLLLYKNKRMIKTQTIEIQQPPLIPARKTISLGTRVNLPAEIDADAFGYSVRMNGWPAAAVYFRYKL